MVFHLFKTQIALPLSIGVALCVSGCGMSSSSSFDSSPIVEGQSAWYGSIPGGNLVSEGAVGGASANAISVTVGAGAVCGNYSNGGTLNQPCTSVTICLPGSTTQCQTISDILVDTGSYGLRVFASALYQNLIQGLTQINDSSGDPISECAQFGTGEDWGPVMMAGVQLGGEAVVQTPIQVINRSFSYAPGACASADRGPSAAGFNGILGVGLLRYDCGAGCISTPGLGNLYFSCSGDSCSGATMALANQVQNPVAFESTDNNGVILSMPDGGDTSSISGTLYLGIGTEANNSPGASVTVYTADSSAEFDTNFNGSSYTQSFIDSGSNVFFFPDGAISVCDSSTSAPGFFCPGSTQSLSATNQSVTAGGMKTGVAGPTVNFTIENANSLVQNGSWVVFDNIGADSSSSGFPDSFDWGLPFFMGRPVTVGLNGKSATINGTGYTGPYWAY